MVNSTFGKTIENLRKRINVELINNAKNYVRYVSKPNFISQKIFSKNFVAVHKIKPALTLNKPIYVGFSIFEFHYKYINDKFDAELLFTVTDSLVYEIKTEYVYESLFVDKGLFDFSYYPLASKFFDSVNKKVIAKMKDEFKGKLISEFIGVKLKLCSFIAVDNEEAKKAKGVNKNIVKKIRDKECVDVLFNKKVIRHNMKRIQSKLYKI